MAFAYDGRPALAAVPDTAVPVCTHHADLPGEKVDLSVCDFSRPAEVILTLADKRGPLARLGDVHRADLPKAELTLDAKDGRVAAGGRLHTTLRFTTPAGRPVAPGKNLSAQVELLDPASTVVNRATATPGATGADYQAALQVPKEPGTFTVRAKTTVTTPEGHAFSTTEDRTVIAAKAHAIAATPIPLQFQAKTGPFKAASP